MCHGYIDRRLMERESQEERVQEVKTPAAEPAEERPGVLARLRAWLGHAPGKRTVPAE